MTRKNAPILHEIIAAIDGIQVAVAGKTFADFQKDWLLRHGAQRAIEIISEASRHVPDHLKTMHPSIRWLSIAGIGNVLRHEYGGDRGCAEAPSLALLRSPSPCPLAQYRF